MIHKLLKDFFRQKREEKISSGDCSSTTKKDARLIDVTNATHVTLPEVAIMRDYQESYTQRDEPYWNTYNLAFSHYNRGWYEKAADEFLKIFNQNHDTSYHTYLLRTFRKIIAAKQEKKKYHEALSYSDELFERCKNYTNNDIKTHNKIIDALGIAIEKKALIEDEKNEAEFTITGDMYFSVSEGKKPRGCKVDNPYEEINPYRIEHLTQTLWPLLPHIHLQGNTVSYIEKPSIPRLKGVAYRLRSVPGNNDYFVYCTDNVELRLTRSTLDIEQSLDCSKLAGDKYHLRCLDMAEDLSLVIFTVTDECFLLDRNLKMIRKWRVPYKIDTPASRHLRRTFTDVAEEEDITWALDSLGISKKDPTTEDVKRAFRELTENYDSQEEDLYKEEEIKEVMRAYEFIRGHTIAGINREELEDEYWMKMSMKQITGFGGFSIHLEMGMGFDPCDWIYGSGISSDGKRIYLGCYSGKIYEMSQNGIVDTIYEMTTQESAHVIFEDSDFLLILTYSQLYIIDRINKKFLKTIRTRGSSLSSKGFIRFFKGGFIHILDHDVILYSSDGKELTRISFKSAPKFVFLSPDKESLVVETGKKLHLFGKKN